MTGEELMYTNAKGTQGLIKMLVFRERTVFAKHEAQCVAAKSVPL